MLEDDLVERTCSIGGYLIADFWIPVGSDSEKIGRSSQRFFLVWKAAVLFSLIRGGTLTSINKLRFTYSYSLTNDEATERVSVF